MTNQPFCPIYSYVTVEAEQRVHDRVFETMQPEPEDAIAAYCNEAITNEEGDELVVKSSRCPVCGERRMDYLFYTDDVNANEIECAKCGTKYTVATYRDDYDTNGSEAVEDWRTTRSRYAV